MLMPVLRRRSLPDKRPVRITTSCTPPLSKRQSTLVLTVIITEPGGNGGNGGNGGSGDGGGGGLTKHCIQYMCKSNRDHFNDALSQTAQLTQLQCIPDQSSRGSSPRMIYTCVRSHTNTLALLSLSFIKTDIKGRNGLFYSLSLSLSLARALAHRSSQ